MKIAVLGGGMIGSVIARLLKEQRHDVTIVDPKYRSELSWVGTYIEFFNDISITKEQDLIVNALPGKIGFDALAMAVEAGKNVVDISFWDYDQDKVDKLDKLAKEKGVTVLYDLGWSPGKTNILIGNAMAELGEVESVDYYVGGLPQKGPYKSPYCVEDSMKFVLESKWEMPKTDRGAVMWSSKCLFESRSLPNFCTPHTYRPLEFPITVSHMKHLGMFKPENLPHTTEILRNEWAIDENYRDISYMDIYVRGKDKTIEYHMVDKYDEKLKMTSMAKLTATTAVLGVELLTTIGRGCVREGFVSPEELGGFMCKEFEDHWKDAGIIIEKSNTFDGIPVESALP